MKQDRMNDYVEYIYYKVLRDHNIIDKKIIDFLYNEAIYFSRNYIHLDVLSDKELYEYIYGSLSMTARNIQYFN